MIMIQHKQLLRRKMLVLILCKEEIQYCGDDELEIIECSSNSSNVKILGKPTRRNDDYENRINFSVVNDFENRVDFGVIGDVRDRVNNERMSNEYRHYVEFKK